MGSTSHEEHLKELLSFSQDYTPLPQDIVNELFVLRRRWSDETDTDAELCGREGLALNNDGGAAT